MYKFAIIGCGKIAPRHAEQIAAIGTLVAVCDVVPHKANTLAKSFAVKSYYSIESLLKNEPSVEILSICTPNGFHAEHAIKALQAGKHVLCEKPLCITSAAAWQMVETEKFSRKRLFVVKSTRYNPLLQQLKKYLENNDLGQVYSFQLNCFWNRPDAYYKDWRGKAFPDGGTLYTQFSHYIDALLWLLGDIDEVKGFAANKAHSASIEFEDTGVVAVTMRHGAVGGINWTVNTFEKNSEIGLTIIAEKGTIALGGEYLHKVIYIQSNDKLHFTEAEEQANDYGFYKGSMSNHKEVYKNLVEALDNKAHPFTSAFDGLKTVEAIEKIYKAVNPSFAH